MYLSEYLYRFLKINKKFSVRPNCAFHIAHQVLEQNKHAADL